MQHPCYHEFAASDSCRAGHFIILSLKVGLNLEIDRRPRSDFQMRFAPGSPTLMTSPDLFSIHITKN